MANVLTASPEPRAQYWLGLWKEWRRVSQNPADSLVSIPIERLRTHALVLGDTGSGKTTLLHHLMVQDLSSEHSFVVLDLRGDLVSAAIELCALSRVNPSLVKLLDLREKQKPFGFNPLFGAGEPYFRALNVLDAVADEASSWGVQLSETLRNALLLLAECGEPITYLERLFYDQSFRRSLLAKTSSQTLGAFWIRYGSESPERQKGLAMPVLNKVSLLFATAALRRILHHPTPIDLGALLNKRGSVLLVSLAVDEVHGAARMMGSLVLSSLCREIFSRAAEGERSRNPLRLYVDEFEHFAGSQFETILAEGRRFGLSLVASHQSLSQLTPKLRSMILANVGTKLLLRCGREDAVALSKDITGTTTDLDLTTLSTGEVVVWTRGEAPFVMEANEPLLKNVGSLSALGRAFLNAVYEHAGTSTDPDLLEQREVAKRPQSTQAGALEEWL